MIAAGAAATDSKDDRSEMEAYLDELSGNLGSLETDRLSTITTQLTKLVGAS